MNTSTNRNTNSDAVNREESRPYFVERFGRIVKRPWRELSEVERAFQIEAEQRALHVALFNPCGLY